jgi:hypothetical protein
MRVPPRFGLAEGEDESGSVDADLQDNGGDAARLCAAARHVRCERPEFKVNFREPAGSRQGDDFRRGTGDGRDGVAIIPRRVLI